MRNIWCPRYDECLTQAAKEESPSFDCTGCPWARNTAGKRSDPAEIVDECISCGDVLAEVFRLPGCSRVIQMVK